MCGFLSNKENERMSRDKARPKLSTGGLELAPRRGLKEKSGAPARRQRRCVCMYFHDFETITSTTTTTTSKSASRHADTPTRT
jgi:hypothetical protein